MKIYNVRQRSDAWDSLRLGIPTASNFNKIITPEGKPSAQWQLYAYHLLAERILQRRVDTYTSPAMENGVHEEERARTWYEMYRGVDVDLVGFVTTDDGVVGCSPDFFVGSDGMGEIKCPQPPAMVEYLIGDGLPKKYRAQTQGGLYICEREWVDIIAWHPDFSRPVVVTSEPDKDYIESLRAQLDMVTYFIDGVTARLCPEWYDRVVGGAIAPDPLSVRLAQQMGLLDLLDAAAAPD